MSDTTTPTADETWDPENRMHFVENVDPADWPELTFSCQHEDCANHGIEITMRVAGIGSPILCGACGRWIVEPPAAPEE